MGSAEKILIASDHGGFRLKENIKNYLKELGLGFEDFGCDSETPVDYPELGKKVAVMVSGADRKGILICGTGIGMSIAANRFKGVRAALCHNEITAKMSREHNDSNILCMGGRILDTETAKRITKTWLETEFSQDARHKRRLEKIDEGAC